MGHAHIFEHDVIHLHMKTNSSIIFTNQQLGNILTMNEWMCSKTWKKIEHVKETEIFFTTTRRHFVS